MTQQKVLLITGSRKGIGRHLAEHYTRLNYRVIGCSRNAGEFESANYEHVCLDVADEKAVLTLFQQIRTRHGRLDALINNAGAAAMNSALLTPLEKVQQLLNTNVAGTFLFCREAAKIMQRPRAGRIVNFSTVAVPLHLEGEAAYVAAKAAVEALTHTLAREFGSLGITVNAVGPTPIQTDLIGGVPTEKIERLIARQAIRRMGEFRDIVNVVDFFLRPESDFITSQIIYLGGISG
jgi:3-oxoacyl-[acyl-carrier protein] reductase